MLIKTKEGAVTRRLRAAAGIVLVAGLAFGAHAQMAVQQPYQEYDKQLRSAEQIGPLSSDLFGDSAIRSA